MIKALTKMRPSKKDKEWIEETAKKFKKEGYEVKGYTFEEGNFCIALGDIVLG